MKYLLYLFVLLTTVTAQGQCSEFDTLLKKGDDYLRRNKPNYQEAINAYTAAIIACSVRAGEAKQRITRMVNEINKLKESAISAEKQAKKAKDEAETALANLEKANADVVKLILENANREIFNLRYEDALQKIKAAASLGALKPEVAKAYLEIAFWYGEMGNIRRASGILDSAALLVNKKLDTDQPHRKSIEILDPAVYKKLMERYYPLMVPVEGGAFDMGCDTNEQCSDLHKQEVSAFQMAKYETTWWQYYLFCVATRHEYVSPGWGTEGDNPVVNVNWFDAAFYLNWVNNQFGLDTFYIMEYPKEATFGDSYDVTINPNAKKGYRLPTEAEWEYAAKGGNRPDKTIYSGSDDLDAIGWHDSNSGSRTRAVGKKQPNALDLYDISGNAYEWCWDWYGDYPKEFKKDYNGLSEGSNRVIRGGSWNYGAEYCRSAFRYNYFPVNRSRIVGFRLVLVR